MSEHQNQPNQSHVSHYPAQQYYYPQTSPAYYPAYYMRQQTPQQQTTQGDNIQGMLPIQRSYIENILRLNKGKHVTVHMTFENNREWNAKVFKGVIEAAGRDHIILSDPDTGKRYLLLMVYLDYVTFDEKINYSYPAGQHFDEFLSNYPPR